MKWIDADIVGTEARDGTLCATVAVRIAWWRPSFWRWVREQIEVTPTWLAWPVALWFVITRGPRMNRGDA